MSEIYQGFLALAGAELCNAARTEAYVRHQLPGFSTPGGVDTDGLDIMLGDTDGYRSPALDPAPWYSEHRPASANFLGFYPRSIDGVEDSPRTQNSTELIEDGAVLGSRRRNSKEVRVTGTLFATNGEGLDAGFRWLKGALEGSGCEGSGADCVGDSMTYLAYKPEFCNFGDEDKYPRVPLSWSWARTNHGKWTNYADGVVSSASNSMRVDTPCVGDGAQWVVEGLIPGQWYRVAIDMTPSWSEVILSVSGHSDITARRAQDHVNVDRTPFVLDFIARNTSEAIRVLKGSGDCNGGTFYIYGAKIVRTPERRSVFLPRFTQGNYSEPASWTWVETGETGAAHAQNLPDITGVEKMTILWKNDTGSSIAIGAGSGVQRLVRGLEPGHYYTAYAKMSASSNAVAPNMDVLNATNELRTSLGYGWYSHRFRATDTQHYIRVQTGGGFTLSSLSSESISLEYLRIDRDESTTPLREPDQLLDARRFLHGAAVLSGPTVLAEYPDDRGGRMMDVEFSFTVARPFIYSETFDLPSALDATTFLVPTGQCENGLPVRRNLYTNPDSVGSGTVMGGINTFAALSVNSATLSYDTSPAGGVAIRIMPNGANNSSWLGLPSSGLQVGHTYTISADFYQAAPQEGTINQNARRIVVNDASGDIDSDPAINSSGTQRISVTFTMTGDVSFIRIVNGSSTQPVWISKILVEESGVSGRPFSGSSMQDVDSRLDLSWEGTANQSVSKYKRTSPVRITDPDCPALPMAPQPPSITPDCASTVTEWRRHWAVIPADRAGGWNEAVPVVKLTTDNYNVRDIRIRFYANPLDEKINEVSPCSYCGEFYISFMPKSSSMTIDAINQTATLDIQGSGEQSAMHLVSDADYGPINWPSMTCDLAYYMTVDISPDEILDVDVELSVALRE